MAAIQKFLFDLDFDELFDSTHPVGHETEGDPVEDIAESEDTIAEAPPPPMFSEEDLKQTREQAYQEGFEAGVAETNSAVEKHVGDALEALVSQFDHVFKAQRDAAESALQLSLAIATAIVGKAFPELARRGGDAEVQALVEQTLRDCREQPQLVVRVAPPLQAAMAERVDALVAAERHAGQVLVVAEGDMAEGDCRVEWDDGGVERHALKILGRIEDIVARNLGVMPSPMDDMGSDSGESLLESRPQAADVDVSEAAGVDIQGQEEDSAEQRLSAAAASEDADNGADDLALPVADDEESLSATEAFEPEIPETQDQHPV